MLYHAMTAFEAPDNIVGKGENPGNQNVLLLPQCFLLYVGQINVLCVMCHLKML